MNKELRNKPHKAIEPYIPAHLTMSPHAFFSEERLKNAAAIIGCNKPMVTRVRNSVGKAIEVLARESGKKPYTLYDFLDDCDHKSAIKRCGGLGTIGRLLLSVTIRRSKLPFSRIRI